MGKRGVLLVAALAVGAFVLFRWLGDGGREGRGAGRPIPEAARAPEPGPAAELEPAETIDAPDEGADASAAESEPRAAVEASPVEPRRASWTVRVVRDGVAVAGAEVTWAAREELDAIRAPGQDPYDRAWSASAPLRRPLRTDGNGEVRVPELPPGTFVVAREGASIGMLVTWEKTRPPLEVALQADRDLAVRVVDPLGAPVADVEVLVVVNSLRVEHRVARPTGADGVALFRRLGLSWGLDASATGSARIDGLFEPIPQAEFAVGAWPQRPLELVLPPHGSVRVEVVGPGGERIETAEREVELGAIREALPGAFLNRQSRLVSRELDEGFARFERVGLDLELEAALDDSPRHPRTRVTFGGPRRPGEEVEVLLELAGNAAELLLRVLADDGEPLRAARVDLSWVRRMGGGSISTGDWGDTDAEGRLRLQLEHSWQEGTTLELRLSHAGQDGARATAVLDLSRELAPGTNDLGDVRLAAEEPLVTGRVVDARGEAVRDAHLSVQGSSEPWRETPVDAEGRFAIRAQPSGPLALRIRAESHAPHADVPFAAGERDLVITLADGARLAGSVLVPDGFPARALRVVARHAGGERSAVLDPSGGFVVRGLPEETVALEFRLVPGGVRVARIDDVAARMEGTGRDARLEAVDLRGAVRALRLEVLLPDRTPARGGWARDLRPAEGSQAAAFVIEDGAARLLLPAGPADVEVCVPGQRLLRLEGVASDRTVVLEPAFTVRCELAAGVDLPPGAELQLSLTPVEWAALQHVSLHREADLAGWWSPAFGDATNTFDERRELLVSVQHPGPHLVSFHVVYGDAGGGRMSFEVAARQDVRRIELDERSAGGTVVVAPDAAQYAERLSGR